MKCIYCRESAGLLKTAHSECRDLVNRTVEKIQDILGDAVVCGEDWIAVKHTLLDYMKGQDKYSKYLLNQIGDASFIRTYDRLILVEKFISVYEYKNRKHMMLTGRGWERKPVWEDYSVVLDKTGTMVLSENAVYLLLNGSTLVYEYKKIVNVGYDEKWKQAYFDVKTSSPYPHRYYFKVYIGDNAVSVKRIYALVACMIFGKK